MIHVAYCKYDAPSFILPDHLTFNVHGKHVVCQELALAKSDQLVSSRSWQISIRSRVSAWNLLLPSINTFFLFLVTCPFLSHLPASASLQQSRTSLTLTE